jgi:FixJ family two-component response regulator
VRGSCPRVWKQTRAPPYSSSTTTLPSATLHAICFRRTGTPWSFLPTARPSWTPTVQAAKDAFWSTSGVDLIERLKSEDRQLPTVVMTGNGAVPIAVQAMKAGAVDFIEKPVGHKNLLASVKRALDQTRDSAKLSACRDAAALRVASLTTRQRQILDLVLAGHPSKNIAADLGISQRTVDNHRAHIMTKTGSKSLSALIRTALAAM